MEPNERVEELEEVSQPIQQETAAQEKKFPWVPVVILVVIGMVFVTMTSPINRQKWTRYQDKKNPYKIVAVENGSCEQALESFLKAVEEQDGNTMYSLMLYPHMEGIDQEELGWFSLESRIYFLNQMFYMETGDAKSIVNYIRNDAQKYGEALPDYTQAYRAEGENMVYRTFFLRADDPERVAPLYLEVVPGMDGNWYVRVLEEMSRDWFGHPWLPVDSEVHGEAILSETDDETWKRLFLNAYATQQNPSIAVKAGFNTPDVLSWSDLAYYYVAATSGYEEGEAYTYVAQYVIPAQDLNGYLYEMLDQTIHVEQINQMKSRLLRDRFGETDISNTGDLLLNPIAPLDRGLSLSAMTITDKELLENGAVRVWMAYEVPEADGEEAQGEGAESGRVAGEAAAQPAVHELTAYGDGEKLHIISYYIYPPGAGEGERLITRYLAADIGAAGIKGDGRTLQLRAGDEETGWRLLGALAGLRLGDEIPEEEVDWNSSQVVKSVYLDCYDRGFLEIQFVEHSGGVLALVYTFRSELLPYSSSGGGMAYYVHGIQFDYVNVGLEDTCYTLEPAHAAQFLEQIEEIYRSGIE